MEITILESWCPPVPQIDRGGIGIHLPLGDDDLLVDCGPLTVHRMVEHGIDLADIEDVFFMHHHIDHNSDFFQFVILGWSLGRDSLTSTVPKGQQSSSKGQHPSITTTSRAGEFEETLVNTTRRYGISM